MKNKKKLVICAIGAAAAADDFDWSECWKNYGGGVEEGNFIINAGLGLSSYVFYDSSNDMDWRTPYFEVSAEYTKKIWVLPFGFGGYFGYSGYGAKGDAGNYDWSVSKNYINFGALVNYHVQLPIEKLDVYTGIRTGVQLRVENYKTNIPTENDDSDTTGYFDLNYRIGATYYFTDLIGANLETGYPVYLKASVSFKF